MSSRLNDRAAESSGIVAAAGLVYVSDAMPGIRRVRTADGFVYMLTENRRLTDKAELKRITCLATLPAYEDVWICPNPRGHLQATGGDARGRKQYRYHPKWRLFRDSAKFERIPAFGEALPRLRRRLRRDLAQMDKDARSSRSGDAKDICLAANGKEKVAKADAEAAYKNTPKAREDARVTRAEATHNVAKEKCDELSGNPKDVCVKQADAVLVKAKADAKVDRVTTDTNQDATTKQADARKDANTDKRDAEYKVAIEKCDALAGSAKDTCVSNAKVQYGK